MRAALLRSTIAGVALASLAAGARATPATAEPVLEIEEASVRGELPTALQQHLATMPGNWGMAEDGPGGSADYAFLDLHLWLDGDMALRRAHAASHVVKDLLMTRFPQLADVVIHIEPPPSGKLGIGN